MKKLVLLLTLLTAFAYCGEGGGEGPPGISGGSSGGASTSGTNTWTAVQTFNGPQTWKENATPANPSATFYKLYVKNDGKLYILNSAGTETEVGAAGAVSDPLEIETVLGKAPAGDLFLQAQETGGVNIDGGGPTSGNNAGGPINIQGGLGFGTGTGGTINIVSGASGSGNGAVGGPINITGGPGLGTNISHGGPIVLTGGAGAGTGDGGGIQIDGGTGGATSGAGGNIVVNGGFATAGNSGGGDINVIGGDGFGTGQGGELYFSAGGSGAGATGNGGDAYFWSGSSLATNGNGGLVSIASGDGVGSGTAGTIAIDTGFNASAGNTISIGTQYSSGVTIGRSGRTFTAVGLSATSATLTTPTISGAITFPDGVRQTFNPDGTNAGINVGAQAGNPSSLTDGDHWYNSSTNFNMMRQNGVTMSLNPMTTANDMVYGGTSGAPTRLPAGTDGYVLTSASGVPTWSAASAPSNAGTYLAARVATIATGTMATSFENGDTIDGIVLATGDRILIKNQNGVTVTGTSTDGIYVVAASGAPTRATDFDASSEYIPGKTVAIREGDVNRGAVFSVGSTTPAASFTLGTHALNWSKIQHVTEYAGSWFTPNIIGGVSTFNSIGAKAVSTTVIGTNIAPSATAVNTFTAYGGDILTGVTGSLSTQQSVYIGRSIANGASYSGTQSVMVGNTIGGGITSSGSNILIGHTVGASITSGAGHVMIGHTVDGSGGNSTGVGNSISLNSGAGAVAFGNTITISSTAGYNTAIGYNVSVPATRTGTITIGPQGATSYASNSLTMGNTAQAINQIVGGESDANTTPSYMRVKVGDASGTNIAGGDLIISPGFGTGLSSSSAADRQGAVRLQSAVLGSSGTTVQSSYIDRFIVCKPLDLTDNTITTVATIALPTLSSAGGKITYTVFCSDGTDVQSNSGEVFWNALNKAGAYTIPTPAKTEDSSCSSGTLTTTWAVSSGTNLVNIRLTADSSLTPTTLRVFYTIINESQQAVTLP